LIVEGAYLTIGKLMNQHSFEIEILGHPMSLDDWNRALAAPRSELPPIDDAGKKRAHFFGESYEAYARRELAGRLGEERMRHRAGLLGEVAGKILEGFSPAYSLVAVIADMVKERWIFTIKTPKGEANVAIPRDLGDDIVDWSLREEIEELRSKFLYGLGLDRVTAKSEQ
jgi:hypothetical protein